MKPHGARVVIKKTFLIALGFLCLGLGAIGIIMPLVPTTPFVLLAAICFSKSNETFHRWLQRSPFFGPFIENYRTKQGVDKSLKVIGILFVWTGLIVSMFTVGTIWIIPVLTTVGIGVTIHLLFIKTKKRGVNMKYVCDVCGYIYDEVTGDVDKGIQPGTKWEDVPDDFLCPLCGVGKEQFSQE